MEKEFLDAWNLQKTEPTEENIVSFYKLLEVIPLFLPTQKNDQVLSVVGKNGEQYLPVLTSDDKKTPEDIGIGGLIETTFPVIKHMVLKPKSLIDGILINPLDEGILMTGEHINKMDSLLMGMSLNRTTGLDKGIELKVPKKIEPPLRKHIINFCNQNFNIHQINYYMTRRNSKENFHKTFFLRFDGRDIDLFPKFVNVLRIFMLSGENFELMKVGEELDNFPHLKETLIFKK